MVEDGGVLKDPGLPVPSIDTIVAAVNVAHRQDKLAIAEILAYDARRCGGGYRCMNGWDGSHLHRSSSG